MVLYPHPAISMTAAKSGRCIREKPFIADLRAEVDRETWPKPRRPSCSFQTPGLGTAIRDRPDAARREAAARPRSRRLQHLRLPAREDRLGPAYRSA